MRASFFFFQAEDGIRDSSVTGVQTCALPICSSLEIAGLGFDRLQVDEARSQGMARFINLQTVKSKTGDLVVMNRAGSIAVRSEERRVGKEGRSRWSPYH